MNPDSRRRRIKKKLKSEQNEYWIKTDLVYECHRLYGMLSDTFHVVLA